MNPAAKARRDRAAAKPRITSRQFRDSLCGADASLKRRHTLQQDHCTRTPRETLVPDSRELAQR